MKKSGIILACIVILVGMMVVPGMAKGGFDEYGYNYNSRIFRGIGENWFRQMQGLPAWEEGNLYLWEPYARDRLVMKWSKAWDDAKFGPDGIRDNGDGGPWTSAAWVTNHWNGAIPGASGEVTWHFKIIWVGPELETSQYWRDGGYPIWGEFEVIMDHGSDVDHNHIWGALATPAGLGEGLGK